MKRIPFNRLLVFTGYSRVNRKAITRCGQILTLLLLPTLHIEAQGNPDEYLRRARLMHDNIYKYFYDSSNQLFKEKTELTKGDKPHSYLWPLCALVQAANEMEVLNAPAACMDGVDRAIDRYYSPAKAPCPGYDSYVTNEGGGDRFYDDNQWLGLAWMDAYQRTKDRQYLERSEEIYRFMMSGYDTVSGGGLYWQEHHKNTKNTCSNGPGVLLALQLYKATNERQYLDTAILLYKWVNARLRSPDGLYFDAIKLPSGEIDKRTFTYNTGTMLQSAVLLYNLTGNGSYLSEAKNIAKQSAAYFFKNGSLPGNYWFNAVLLRGYLELYRADGARDYVLLFKNYIDQVWQSQRDARNLIGTKPVKTLLDQAGYLEMLARMSNFLSRKNTAASNKDTRPNIVVILADDLGYSDIGCYGGEIATPNLNYLAANGIRFRRFYNTSRCCPTRASLLTGMYNHNAGMGEMTSDRGLPGYRGFLSPNTVTLAEVLKGAGYHTGMVGKWHVSNTIEQKDPQAQLRWLAHQEEHPLFSPVEQYPVNRGFEKYYGNIWGVVDYFDPFSLVNGTTPVKSVPAGYYHTDAINDSAVAYIKVFSQESRPFFLYVAETAPHWPLHALPEEIRKYENTYKAGWDAIRASRYQRMIKLGLVDAAKAPLSPRWQNDLSWENNPDKDWDARAMAVHAAMVDRMDQGIGRIINALKATGQLENTLILFLSDNGASPENAMQYGVGFDRPGETRDGKKIAYPVKKEVMPGPETTFSSIGPRWANVANTPYQFAKADSYEGGIRTPMIAFWPAGIKVAKGGFSDRVGHVMDFMATFVELAQAKYPLVYNGNTIKPMQGSSLVPAFTSTAAAGHNILFNEHFGARYVRYDGWKLVSRSNQPWHLYRIDDDETEVNDLAAQHPEVVQQLDSMWQQWTKANQVVPKQKGKGAGD